MRARRPGTCAAPRRPARVAGVLLVGAAVAVTGCLPLRWARDQRVEVVVGPPRAGGARVVEVRADRLGDTTATFEVRLDRVVGSPLVSVTSRSPARITLSGEVIPPGRHVLVATVRAGHRRRHGTAVLDTALRLNQLQGLGSHNSYHVAPTDPPWNGVLQWQYTHSPLDVQLSEEGIRQLELDVFVDPAGHFVAHVPDVDAGTTCVRLVECLRVIRGWSDAHRRHAPIAVLVELKDDDYGLPTPIRPWTRAAMDQLDAEIRSIFPPGRLVTPDDVRGRRTTLREAVLRDGWPRLETLRGRVIFLMDNAGAKRHAYRQGRPSLEGAVLFTNSSPGDPDAAFVKRNDPPADIAELVDAGYLVRTRADADTWEARADDRRRAEVALASGAHWVSTDFPVPGRAFGTPYVVTIPGGSPLRCNPVNTPAWCRSGMVEDLAADRRRPPGDASRSGARPALVSSGSLGV